MFRSRSSVRIRSSVRFSKPSMTEQHHLNDVNINSIISRYNRTGVLGDPFRAYAPGVFGDFSEVKDFHGLNNEIVEAKEKFMDLPSALRKRFNNDPLELIDFLQDSRNDEEAIKLGLKVSKRPVEGVGTVTSLDVTVPTDTERAEKGLSSGSSE